MEQLKSDNRQMNEEPIVWHEFLYACVLQTVVYVWKHLQILCCQKNKDELVAAGLLGNASAVQNIQTLCCHSSPLLINLLCFTFSDWDCHLRSYFSCFFHAGLPLFYSKSCAPSQRSYLFPSSTAKHPLNHVCLRLSLPSPRQCHSFLFGASVFPAQPL